MTDPVLKPLDPIYARNDFRGERADIEHQRKEAKYNREREKRIAKCWGCGSFAYCFDPANCRKEKKE